MSFAARPIEESAMEQWVLLCSSRFDAGKGFQYAMFDRSSKMVGSIGIDVDEDRPTVVRVGYWLHVDHQGHGYATDAVRALKDLALGPLGMTEVELGCDRANVRSVALAERLGFILERVDHRAPTNPGRDGRAPRLVCVTNRPGFVVGAHRRPHAAFTVLVRVG
jgi:RimJ/RimL family protein N-acetyltransferase